MNYCACPALELSLDLQVANTKDEHQSVSLAFVYSDAHEKYRRKHDRIEIGYHAQGACGLRASDDAGITDALVLVCRRPLEVNLQPDCFERFAIRNEQNKEDDGVDDDKRDGSPYSPLECLTARSSDKSTVEHQDRDRS